MSNQFFLERIPNTLMVIVFFCLLLGGSIAKGFFPSATLLDIGTGLVFVFSLLVLLINRRSFELSLAIKLWIGLVVSVILFNLYPEIIRLIDGEPYSGKVVGFVERFLLLIVFILVTLALSKIKLSAITFFKILVLSSFWIALVILGEGMVRGVDSFFNVRFGDIYSSNIIDFGIYSNVLFIILLGGFLWFKQLSLSWKILFVLAISVDFLGVILSQSRTAWIGWPEAIIGWGGFYFYYFCRFKKSCKLSLNNKGLWLAGIMLIVLILSPISKILQQRISLAIDNIEKYEKGEPLSSLGKRFIMYKVGAEHVLDSPILGIGVNHFKPFLQENTQKVLYKEYGIKSGGFEYSQIHNQFLMTFLTEGILAFLSLIGMFLFLLIYFITRLRKSVSAKSKALAVAGIVYTVASIMSFMPESPLNFKVQLFFFFTIITLLIAVNEGRKMIDANIAGEQF